MDRIDDLSHRLSSALPRHFLQAALLLLIGRRPAYGYDLRAQLAQMGVDRQDWSQLYRCLRSMERSGLVVSCWESSESGPARRTYHVTEKGQAQLREWADGMAAAQALVSELLARYARWGLPALRPSAGSA